MTKRRVRTRKASQENVDEMTERKTAQEDLQQSEESFRDLAENTNDVVFEIDMGGRVTYVSPKMEAATGYSPSELIGRPFTQLLHQDDLPSTIDRAQKRISGNREASEYRLLTKSGEERWVCSLGRPVFEGDRVVGFRAVLTNITDRKRAEEALQQSETRFRTLAETAAAAIFIYQGSRIRYANTAAEGVTGYTREELLAMDFWEVIHPEHRDLVKKRGLRRQRGQEIPARYEVKIATKNGEERWIEFVAARIKIDGAPSVLGTAFDITERKKVEEAVRHLAYHDSLTGLPNRPLLMDRLQMALAQARRSKGMVAVMAMDLDRFKVVNDTVGHAEGDRLLQQVGEQLTGLVRDGDTVARFGGDEFTVVLPQVARIEDAIQVGERILEALRQPKVLGGEEFRVTTSMGISAYPHDGEDADTLLRGADWALYRAKDEGRDNYQVCTPTIAASLRERISIERDLRRALERDEMTLHYQPLVEIETGQVIGVEALVRWQHPKRGLLLPAEFIRVAEETGLIVPMGKWVLRSAARQHSAWREAGLGPGRLAVNFSARQFQDPLLADLVAQALEEAGLDPQHLQVEITEQTAMQDVDFTLATLGELKMAGVTIAVDDFGAGYSSLGYLRRFPIDVLKINRSFVDDLPGDPDDAALSSAIIAMGHALSLKVIAEGVETEEQLAFLREQGCDEFQGYLFSKPLPPAALTRLLKRGKRLLGVAPSS